MEAATVACQLNTGNNTQQHCNLVVTKNNLPERVYNTENTGCATSEADCTQDAKAKATDVLAACTAA